MMTTILPSPEHIYAAAARMDDCGTARCLWGGGCIEADVPVPREGPPAEWGGQSVEHALLTGAMSHPGSDVPLAAVERIRTGKTSNSDRGEAVRVAAKHGHVEIARMLLASGLISNCDRAWAFRLAVHYGHAEIARMLLALGPISVHAREEAVRLAAKYGHADIVRMVLASGRIRGHARSEAVRLAGENGHIVEALLPSGPIRSHVRAEAVWWVETSDLPEIAKMLVK